MALTPSHWQLPQRPWNLPGLNRDNAPSQPVDPGLVSRISGQVRSWLGMLQPGGSELPFFPPGRPLEPSAQGAGGRRFDYPTSYNTIYSPRAYEPINFETLRAMAEPALGGYDLIRLAIETRKDQLGNLKKSILPRKIDEIATRPKSDARCAMLERLFERPDGETPWQQWVGQLVEEHLVIDAATILRKKSLGGQTIGIELIDGSTIKPLINYDGRTPTEGPAYQQIMKGVVAADFSKDDLLYVPRNRRVHKIYGQSPVEQVLVTVNIGLRRQAQQLAFFTDGNVPDSVWQVPPTWSTQQIAEFQSYWDATVNDAVTRRKMRFAPGGVTPVMTRPPEALVDQFDEWIARIIAFCFSLPPTPFVRLVNRATGETMYEEALQEGLMPLMTWVKSILDHVIKAWFGFDDIEMVWDDIRKVDPSEKEQRDIALANEGAISLDDIRADRGLEPLHIPPMIKGLGPMGFMSIESVKKAIQNGWDLTGVPPPAAPGAETAGLEPGGGADVAGMMQGLPPEIIDALGIGDPTMQQQGQAPTGAEAPEQQVQPGTQQGPPGAQQAQAAPPPDANASQSNVIPFHQHPGVKAALAHGDAMARQHAAKMKRGRDRAP